MRKFKIGDVVKIIDMENLGTLREEYIKRVKILIITGYEQDEVYINNSNFSFLETRFKKISKVNYLPSWF